MKSFILSVAALPLLAACVTVPAAAPLEQVPEQATEQQTEQTTEQAGSAPSVLESAIRSDAGKTVVGKALVTAADPRAAQAGAQILRQGGSAADAAIAVMLALTVVEPQSSGIGGGGFFVRGDAAGNVVTIDGRETAPAEADESWFLGTDGEPLGYAQVVQTGKSVGVPGSLALAADAHRRYGRIAWERLFAPAIALARGGFEVTPRFNEYLGQFKDRGAASGQASALFYDAAGEPLAVGMTVRNPVLAATLERLAAEGEPGFYRGDTARELVRTVAAATPGAAAMAASDLARYETRFRPPVCGDYRGYRICGMGPPSSGATTVIAILEQLERFDLARLGPDDPAFWHLFAESQRLAYADRERYLADSDFVGVPVGWLTDPAYLAARSAMISSDGRLAEVSAGVAPQTALAPPDGDEPPESGTSHFAVLDTDGNAVSYTSTIEGPFGSGLMFGGFYLNNELTDFSFAPELDGRPVANRVEGGKRPRSSMAPTLIYAPDGSLFMVVGAAGGGTIPVQTAKAIIAAIDFGMTVDKALALPVLYSPGDKITMEAGSMLEGMMGTLRAMGHDVGARTLPLKANAILCRAPAPCTAAGDPRSEGMAVAAD